MLAVFPLITHLGKRLVLGLVAEGGGGGGDQLMFSFEVFTVWPPKGFE